MMSKDKPQLDSIKSHWEDPAVVSLKDENLRILEINSIVSGMKKFTSAEKNFKLADFGCGDGLDTECFSELAGETFGYDYSTEMLSRASKRTNSRLHFRRLDLITENITEIFDVAISKRFIINLGDWKIQSRSLSKIADALKPGGFYFMLECFISGLEGINNHRVRTGLPLLREPFHNSYLDYEQTIDFLSEEFDILDLVDFSTYYFLTRCVSPILATNDLNLYDTKFRNFSESNDFLQGLGLGPQKLLCLRKKQKL